MGGFILLADFGWNIPLQKFAKHSGSLQQQLFHFVLAELVDMVCRIEKIDDHVDAPHVKMRHCRNLLSTARCSFARAQKCQTPARVSTILMICRAGA